MLSSSEKPWEIEPNLKNEYLCEIAKTIKEVRHTALELHDPDNGDGPWSLGCRAYERTINKIEQLSEKLPWLGCIRNNLYFVMLIGGIPVRFYRGKAEEPTSRSLKQHYPELKAIQLTFNNFLTEWYWRIAVETDDNGEVLRIVLVQINKSTIQPMNLYTIPFEESIPSISPVVHLKRDGVVLDKPEIKPKKPSVIERERHGKKKQ